MHLSISNDIVSTKIYDKRDDFDFEIVNLPFLDGDVPRSISYGVYISQLIRFAKASSYVADFNKLLTQKPLKQGYWYHQLRKTFSKFNRRYYDLTSKFQVGLKSLLRQGLLEPEFYGDLVYKLKKTVGSNKFLAQFIKIMSHYKKMAITLMYCNRLHAFLLNCIHGGGGDFRLYDGSGLNTYLLMRWQGPDALAVVRPTRGYLLDFFYSCIQLYLLLSPYLCFISFFIP